MSTLKTVSIIHPAGSTNNIVSDSSGNVTIGNNTYVVGNAGIGVSTPLQRLHVSGATNGSSGVSIQSTGSSGRRYTIYSDSAGGLGFFDDTGGSERMRIDTSGNIVIGNSSASERLSVYSAIGVRGSNFASTSFFGSSVNTNGVYTGLDSGGGYVINVRDAGYQAFSTNNLERSRIDSSGNFLINTTSTTLFSATSGYGVCYRRNASLDVLVTSDNAVILNRTSTDGSIQEFRRNGNIVGSISVTTVATTYNTVSDYRLKTNVKPLQGSLSKIESLKPVTYDWKQNGTSGEGFIAHELQGIIPYAVSGEKDAVTDDGSIKPQGVDYSKIVVHLVSAIQELKAELDALKGKVA